MQTLQPTTECLFELKRKARPFGDVVVYQLIEKLRLFYQYYLIVECIPDCFMFYVLSFYMYLSTLQYGHFIDSKVLVLKVGVRPDSENGLASLLVGPSV